MMLVALCSAKGSPGVSSLSLALTAGWTRPATLLEADPSGSDLIYRCRHRSGREVAITPNILGLAAAVRGSSQSDAAQSSALAQYTQPLACGVPLVPGVAAPAQARGLSGLWPQVAEAAMNAAGDVIVDLGRVDRTSSTTPLAAASAVLLVVCQSTLESVIHARELVRELVPTLPPITGGRRIIPAVVGPRGQIVNDAADIDQLLFEASLLVDAAAPIAYDPRSLSALEAGANPRGRLARGPLMRSVTQLVNHLTRPTDNASADDMQVDCRAIPEARIQ
jgi:hypothetical protein